MLPGRVYARRPLDSEGYGAQVYATHVLVLDALDDASNEVETLLNIAESAISEM